MKCILDTILFLFICLLLEKGFKKSAYEFIGEADVKLDVCIFDMIRFS